MEPVVITNLPVYKKALDIFKMSRIIACEFSNDKHLIEMDLSKNRKEQIAGELVSNSLQLAPALAAVQNSSSNSLRLKRTKNLKKFSRLLSVSCRKTEYLEEREKEFILLLRQELDQFNQLLNDWLYNLHLRQKRN